VKHLAKLGLLLLFCLSGGCALFGDVRPLRPAIVESCAQWLAQLDQSTADAGRTDAAYARIAHYPYLRVDRFTASLKDDASESLASLLEKMRLLDVNARRHELLDYRQLNRVESCGLSLLANDLQDSARMRRLVDSIEVPNDYVTAYRVIGVYGLTRLPFALGVSKLEAERRTQFAASVQPLERLQETHRKGIIYAAAAPSSNDAELDRLYRLHAPVFVIPRESNADVPGALEWKGNEVGVNIAKPVMYTHLVFTRYGEHRLRQLVYTVWFSERPVAKGAFIDLLAGKLDGLMIRVTLAPDGSALVYDSIHPCGCYHQFFPTAAAVAKPYPTGLDEWAFIPRTLPAWQPGDKLLVQVASGTHYIDNVNLIASLANPLVALPYSALELNIQPYENLRSLPTGDGGYRSAFDPRGFIQGSERLESWLFWPMGIANAGAMRQWGKHATAFVGRRHFDDPRLMEDRFVFNLR
jgi:hypothetical protein